MLGILGFVITLFYCIIIHKTDIHMHRHIGMLSAYTTTTCAYNCIILITWKFLDVFNKIIDGILK